MIHEITRNNGLQYRERSDRMLNANFAKILTGGVIQDVNLNVASGRFARGTVSTVARRTSLYNLLNLSAGFAGASLML